MLGSLFSHKTGLMFLVGFRILFSHDEPTILMDGKEFQPKQPISVFGKYAYIPLEEFFSKIGYKVEKNKQTKETICQKDNIEIVFSPDKVVKNRFVFDIDHDILQIDKKKMIGLDLLAKLINKEIIFNKTKNRIEIKEKPIEPYSWKNNSPLIAHALGGVDGHWYTNSFEAFQRSYRNGYKIFEADLALTSDKQLVAKHDWSIRFSKQLQQEIPTAKANKPLTLQEFKNMKILNSYTPITFEEIVQQMSAHRDIYLVTDTKDPEPEKAREEFTILVNTVKKIDPTVLKRIIPQVYNEKMYQSVKQVYPFDSYIFTLYQARSTEDQIVDFVKRSKIKVVTMWSTRANNVFVHRLNSVGADVFTHSVNFSNEIYLNRSAGVSGFYTDYIIPDRYSEIRSTGTNTKDLEIHAPSN